MLLEHAPPQLGPLVHHHLAHVTVRSVVIQEPFNRYYLYIYIYLISINFHLTGGEVDMGALFPAGAAPHRVGRVAVDGVGSDNEEGGVT